jgi:hypothetical protein
MASEVRTLALTRGGDLLREALQLRLLDLPRRLPRGDRDLLRIPGDLERLLLQLRLWLRLERLPLLRPGGDRERLRRAGRSASGGGPLAPWTG